MCPKCVILDHANIFIASAIMCAFFFDKKCLHFQYNKKNVSIFTYIWKALLMNIIKVSPFNSSTILLYKLSVQLLLIATRYRHRASKTGYPARIGTSCIGLRLYRTGSKKPELKMSSILVVQVRPA